jgi:NAD(P)-dependent dehydrogenase (short-subunit alcohol dehydrogenase family)
MDTREHSLLPFPSLRCQRAQLIIPVLAFFYPQESPEAVEYHKANGMGGRLTMVEDIAPIVRFLCTEGTWITGQTIFANGGYTTR